MGRFGIDRVEGWARGEEVGGPQVQGAWLGEARSESIALMAPGSVSCLSRPYFPAFPFRLRGGAGGEAQFFSNPCTVPALKQTTLSTSRPAHPCAVKFPFAGRPVRRDEARFIGDGPVFSAACTFRVTDSSGALCADGPAEEAGAAGWALLC